MSPVVDAYRPFLHYYSASARNINRTLYGFEEDTIRRQLLVHDLSRAVTTNSPVTPVEEPVCCVCLDSIDSYDEIRTRCCRQGFHKDCLLACKACPLCRSTTFLNQKAETGDPHFLYRRMILPRVASER